VDVSCLLTPILEGLPEANTAVAAVKVVVEYLTTLGFEVAIDTSPLERKAEELQNTIQNLLNNEKHNNQATDSIYS